jgi:hypothetical protein
MDVIIVHVVIQINIIIMNAMEWVEPHKREHVLIAPQQHVIQDITVWAVAPM